MEALRTRDSFLPRNETEHVNVEHVPLEPERVRQPHVPTALLEDSGFPGGWGPGSRAEIKQAEEEIIFHAQQQSWGSFLLWLSRYLLLKGISVLSFALKLPSIPFRLLIGVLSGSENTRTTPLQMRDFMHEVAETIRRGDPDK